MFFDDHNQEIPDLRDRTNFREKFIYLKVRYKKTIETERLRGVNYIL